MVSEEARKLYEEIIQLPEPERKRIFGESSNEMKAGLWLAQLEKHLATADDLTPEQRAFIERWMEQISAPDWFALDARDPVRREELQAFEREVLTLFPREVAGLLFQHLGPPQCGMPPTSRRPPGTPE